mmetsp:Transcript_1343/g.5474  ORF Transcript_1343/g.5474 Transcript_1343/m.5474 type:complete len:255 (-) Transcript_1343:619-1383(-)
MCSPPYRSATRRTPGASSATRRHSSARLFRLRTNTGTSEPPPTAPFACAETIICANASLRTLSICPLANASSIAPSTGAGRPPPHTQSRSRRCASGQGTSQQSARASCFTGPPPARPRAAITSASSAGGNAPAAFPFPPPFEPPRKRSKSDLAFAPTPGICEVGARLAFARADANDASPASACRRVSSSFGMSATYHVGRVRSSASSCARRPCTYARLRESSVGASDTPRRGRKVKEEASRFPRESSNAASSSD